MYYAGEQGQRGDFPGDSMHPTPCSLGCIGDLKSAFLLPTLVEAPRILVPLHHCALSMRRQYGCTSHGGWPDQWGPFTGSSTTALPKVLSMLLLHAWPVCSKGTFVHSPFSVHWDHLFQVNWSHNDQKAVFTEWALWAAQSACQGVSLPFKKCMKYPHALDSAKHFSVCLCFPFRSSFQINSLLDTKKD